MAVEEWAWGCAGVVVVDDLTRMLISLPKTGMEVLTLSGGLVRRILYARMGTWKGRLRLLLWLVGLEGSLELVWEATWIERLGRRGHHMALDHSIAIRILRKVKGGVVHHRVWLVNASKQRPY